MPKYHVRKPVHHHGELVTEGVIELDEKTGEGHVKTGYLAHAHDTAEVTHEFKQKGRAKKNPEGGA